jgi:1-acyl-sn-glycerol-3-phosphate acyltransferase
MVLYTSLEPEVHNKLYILMKPQLWNYWIIGKLVESVGGIKATKLEESGNLVDDLYSRFKNESFILAISPKGKRDIGPWKSGYFHLHNKFDCPIVTVGLDYTKHCFSHRTMGFHYTVYKTSNTKIENIELMMKRDMGTITPLYPENSEVDLVEDNPQPSVCGWFKRSNV